MTHVPTPDETIRREKRQRLDVWLPESLVERVKNAVDALQGPPRRLRLSSLMEAAVLDYVQGLEREANKGRPFPARPGKLADGSRLRS